MVGIREPFFAVVEERGVARVGPLLDDVADDDREPAVRQIDLVAVGPVLAGEAVVEDEALLRARLEEVPLVGGVVGELVRPVVLEEELAEVEVDVVRAAARVAAVAERVVKELGVLDRDRAAGGRLGAEDAVLVVVDEAAVDDEVVAGDANARAVGAVRIADVRAGELEIFDAHVVRADHVDPFVLRRMIGAGEIDLRSSSDAAQREALHVDRARVGVGAGRDLDDVVRLRSGDRVTRLAVRLAGAHLQRRGSRRRR